VRELGEISERFSKRWTDAGGKRTFDNIAWLPRVLNPEFEKIAKAKGGWGARVFSSGTPSDNARKWLKLETPNGESVVGHIDHLKRTYKLEEMLKKEGAGLEKTFRDKHKNMYTAVGATADEINEVTMRDYGVNIFSTNIPVMEHLMATRVGNKEAGVQFFEMVKGLGKSSTETPNGWKSLSLKVADDAPEMVKSTAKELNNSGLVYPKEIAEHMDSVYKAYFSDEATKGAIKHYDNLLNYWKGTVTSLFPAFHGRNFISNLWQNYLGGVKSIPAYTKAGRIRTKIASGSTLSKGEQKLWDRFVEQGLAGYGYFGADLAKKYHKEVVPKTVAQKAKSAIPFSPGSLEVGRKVGNVVEDTAKLAHFIDKTGKGYSDTVAASSVRKYLFDYADLAPFEKNAMKRIMPFYTFSRKNLPMELEAAITEPGKFSTLIKSMRAGGFENQPADYLPTWMQSEPLTKTTDKEGKERYGYGYDIPAFDILNYLEEKPQGGLDVARSVEKSAGRLTGPFLKGPIEWMTGRHWYYGKDLEDITTVYPIAAKALKAAGIDDELGIREETSSSGKKYYKTSNPGLLHVVNSLFGRMYATAGRVKTEEGAEEQLRNAMFGIKTKEIDPESEEDSRNYDMVKRIGEWLKKSGLIKEFRKFYIPKED